MVKVAPKREFLPTRSGWQDACRVKFPRQPELSSRNAGWQDILLEYHNQPGFDTGEVVAAVHQIFVSLPESSIPVERQLESYTNLEHARNGDVLIAPAGARWRINRRYQAKFMSLSFEPAWLKHMSQALLNHDNIQLVPKAPPLKDALIQGILLNLKQALENDELGRNFYVDQLKTMLAVHLLHTYATPSPKPQAHTGGLSRQQLQRSLDYIQANLNQTIRLNDIATLIGMSQYYFCRLFRDAMGITPNQYVIAQRVERAKAMLRLPQRQAIADIALACGFSNQSHLSKHFRNVTGMTPLTYRKSV